MVDRINKLENLLRDHQHSDDDGTQMLTKGLRLSKDQLIKLADCEIAQIVQGIDTAAESNTLIIAVGRDPRTGFATSSANAQVDIVHQPNSTVSYFTGKRPPLYTTSNLITTISGASTMEFNGFNFEINQLAGSLVNIFDSTGTLVETRTIASNTATTITISGTWGATTSGYAYIFFPMYLGISNHPWQRAYVMDGAAGGLRFGGGVTGGGQNTLLYTDAAGDLYYRNLAGSSVKLN